MIAPVTVYWRPGCPFCSRLRQDLRVMGLPAREANIWADPSAAARVRTIADGDETVPTVVADERAFVNPTAAAVLAEAPPGLFRHSSRNRPWCGRGGGRGCCAPSSGESSPRWWR